MGEAKVTLSLTDLTNRVQSAGGYYGGIVIPAKKGTVGVPTLVTNDSQLLERYTPNQKIEVGFDNSYYSAKAFLLRSNKFWVVRVAGTGYKFGNLEVVKSTSSNTSAPAGVVPAVTESAVVTFTATAATEVIVLGGMTYTAHGTTETTSAAVLAAAFLAGVANPSVGTGALTITDALELAKWSREAGTTSAKVKFTSVTTNTNVTDLTSSGTGSAKAVVVISQGSVTGTATGVASTALDGSGTAYTFSADGLFLLYGVNEGVWNNDISVTITTGNSVKAPEGSYAFLIKVFLSGSLKESWTVSRKLGQKDGYGKTMYIEDVLKSSQYIRAYDNVATDTSTVLPKAFSGALSFDGGNDGAAVVDGDVAIGYQALDNDIYPVTFIMDGGHAVPAVHQAIISQAESRLDRYAILSFPFEDESASDYLAALQLYKETTIGVSTYLGGLYTSYVNIYDADNDRSITVSPDGYVAALFSQAATQTNHLYTPISGFNTGNLSALGVNSLYRNFTQGERDLLADSGINAIRFIPGRGCILWGQNTLYGTPSALSHANVSGLLIEIRPAIVDYLNELLFEINDFVNDKGIRFMVRTRLEAYLNQFIPNGMYDKRVLCDDSNNTAEDIDNYRMNVWIYIKPARDIEEIPFKTVLTPTSVSFDLAISSSVTNTLA